MTAEIVSLHDAPLLTDIPGMLRRLADQIAAGEHGKVSTAFLVIPVDSGYPTVFGWGDIFGGNDPVIQFELAKMWLLNNLVARK